MAKISKLVTEFPASTTGLEEGIKRAAERIRALDAAITREQVKSYTCEVVATGEQLREAIIPVDGRLTSGTITTHVDADSTHYILKLTVEWDRPVGHSTAPQSVTERRSAPDATQT